MTGEILRQLQHVPDKADFVPSETALLAASLQRDEERAKGEESSRRRRDSKKREAAQERG